MLAAQARLAPLLARDGLRGVEDHTQPLLPERDRRWPESTTRTTTSAARSFPALATMRPLGLVGSDLSAQGLPFTCLPVILYR